MGQTTCSLRPQNALVQCRCFIGICFFDPVIFQAKAFPFYRNVLTGLSACTSGTLCALLLLLCCIAHLISLTMTALLMFSYGLQPMHVMHCSAHGTTDKERRKISREFPRPSSSKNLEDSPDRLKEDTLLEGLEQQVTKEKGRRRNRRNAAATPRKNTEHDLELEAQRLIKANQQMEHDIAMMRLQMRTARRQQQQQLQHEADAFVDKLVKKLEASRKAQ